MNPRSKRHLLSCIWINPVTMILQDSEENQTYILSRRYTEEPPRCPFSSGATASSRFFVQIETERGQNEAVSSTAVQWDRITLAMKWRSPSTDEYPYRYLQNLYVTRECSILTRCTKPCLGTQESVFDFPPAHRILNLVCVQSLFPPILPAPRSLTNYGAS